MPILLNTFTFFKMSSDFSLDRIVGVTQLDLRGKWVERDKHAQRL